jgi:hypothetical protein
MWKTIGILFLLLLGVGCIGERGGRGIHEVETTAAPTTSTPTYSQPPITYPSETKAPTTEMPETTAPSEKVSEAPFEEPIPLVDLQWVNSKPLKISDLRGKVVLLEFWNRFCTRCQRLHPRY